MPELTIVITTKNKYPLTRFCLESISWTLPSTSYDILIVDNGSTDQTLELANNHRFITNTQGGLYESWNIGIQEARTPYVAVLNNDIYFCSQDWWLWFKQGFESTSLRWLYPVEIESQPPVFEMYNLVKSATEKRKLDITIEIGNIHASCFLIHKELYDKVGLFDNGFDIWYGEKDYEIRMLMQGLQYGQVNNVVIRHFGSSTLNVMNKALRPYEIDLEREFELESRARRDYDMFYAKYSDVDLSEYGIGLKDFGPFKLKL